MKTLVSWVVTLVLFAGCSPCTEDERPSSSVSCLVSDGGYVLSARPYFALEVPEVLSCIGTLQDGTLRFVTRQRVCSGPQTVPDAITLCEVPPLPPGEYPLPGGDVLTLPADGGAPTCTNN